MENKQMERECNLAGNVWIMGDNVDTDNIFPTRFGADASPKEMGTHVFIDFRSDFNQNAKKGDILLAGYNFGYGSYRETAVTGLWARGINVIIARSFARAYYRNAVNLGVYPLIFESEAWDFIEGDMARVNVESGLLLNERTGSQYQCLVPKGLEAGIIQAGGATKYFEKMVIYKKQKA
jgi:3-isopropylmalate dehydratase small subunit